MATYYHCLSPRAHKTKSTFIQSHPQHPFKSPLLDQSSLNFFQINIFLEKIMLKLQDVYDKINLTLVIKFLNSAQINYSFQNQTNIKKKVSRCSIGTQKKQGKYHQFDRLELSKTVQNLSDESNSSLKESFIDQNSPFAELHFKLAETKNDLGAFSTTRNTYFKKVKFDQNKQNSNQQQFCQQCQKNRQSLEKLVEVFKAKNIQGKNKKKDSCSENKISKMIEIIEQNYLKSETKNAENVKELNIIINSLEQKINQLESQIISVYSLDVSQHKECQIDVNVHQNYSSNSSSLLSQPNQYLIQENKRMAMQILILEEETFSAKILINDLQNRIKRLTEGKSLTKSYKKFFEKEIEGEESLLQTR